MILALWLLLFDEAHPGATATRPVPTWQKKLRARFARTVAPGRAPRNGGGAPPAPPPPPPRPGLWPRLRLRLLGEPAAPSSDERERQLRHRYFLSLPDPIAIQHYSWLGRASDASLLVAAILLVVSAATAAGVLALLGVVLGVAASVTRSEYERGYLQVEPRKSHRQMDQMLAALVRTCSEDALRELGLTPEDLVATGAEQVVLTGLDQPPDGPRDTRRPLVVCSPVLRSRKRVGDKRIWRFSAYDVWILCPTGRGIATVHWRVDVVTGNRTERFSQEFFWSDIVAVVTRRGAVSEPTPRSGVGRQELEFAVTGTDRTSVAGAYSGRLSHGVLRATGIEEATAAIRLLRLRLRPPPPSAPPGAPDFDPQSPARIA